MHDLGAMVGRQTPFLALIVPFILVFMVGGRRGLREAWPAPLTAGLVFAVVQFAVSNYISIHLTDILAALAPLPRWYCPCGCGPPPPPRAALGGRAAIAGAAVSASFERHVGRRSRREATGGPPLSRKDVLLAFAPYLIIIVVLGLTSLHSITLQLDKATNEFKWPGLHVLNAKGKAPTSETFKFNWLTAAGTRLFVSGVLRRSCSRVSPAPRVARLRRTLPSSASPILTVCAVLGARLRDEPLGPDHHARHLGRRRRRLLRLPLAAHRWFGTAVTGSDTSTNSLFGALQVAAAKHGAACRPCCWPAPTAPAACWPR